MDISYFIESYIISSRATTIISARNTITRNTDAAIRHALTQCDLTIKNNN